MNDLGRVDGFLVDQTVETVEVLTSFESRNRYDVRSSGYDMLCSAVEDGSMMVERLLLGGWRPIDVSIQGLAGAPDLHLESPFSLVRHEATVRAENGEPVGTIRRLPGLLRRSYEVRDAADGGRFEITGTLLHPWTFHVVRDGERVGRISKRWSGLFREAATDADRFEASFPVEWPDRHKTLLLSAVLFLDFKHFENRILQVLDVGSSVRR